MLPKGHLLIKRLYISSPKVYLPAHLRPVYIIVKCAPYLASKNSLCKYRLLGFNVCDVALRGVDFSGVGRGQSIGTTRTLEVQEVKRLLVRHSLALALFCRKPTKIYAFYNNSHIAHQSCRERLWVWYGHAYTHTRQYQSKGLRD